MISLSEPGNSGEYRGEPGNLWHPGIWTTPTANSCGAKTAFVRGEDSMRRKKGDGCKQ